MADYTTSLGRHGVAVIFVVQKVKGQGHRVENGWQGMSCVNASIVV